MPTPPSGSQIASSDLLLQSRRRKRRWRKQKKQLQQQMKKMKLSRPTAEITWTKIRHLTREAKQLLTEQGKSLTASMYFLAFLAIISAPQRVEGVSYWAYVPNPPILQPVGWLDPEPLKVLTNDSVRMGGAQDSDARTGLSSLITFEGRADSLPICISLQGRVPSGCLSTRYSTFLTDGPDKENAGRRWMWEIQMQTLGNPNYHDNFTKVHDLPIDPCIGKYRDKNQFWDSSLSKFPTWLACGFSDSAMWVRPVDYDYEIWDYSNSNSGVKRSNGKGLYEDYIDTHKDKYHNYAWTGLGEPLRRWFSPGFVEPYWFAKHENKTRKHTDLFRLVAAANMFLEKKPNHTKSEPVGLKACIAYPNALLLAQATFVNISQEGKSYKIVCHSCKLTNCITSAEQKELGTMIIVRRPPFVMLPVDLGNDPWYDNSAMQVLNTLNELIRPKRFVAVLILGITTLISILTTFAMATTALVQEIHTAHYVNALNKNITSALLEQEAIDKKLEAKLNVLEEVVLVLGQDIANLKTTLSTRCHDDFKSICVTPLPYNTSQPWDKVKAHLQGLWRDNDITHDLAALQKDISAMSQSHLKLGGLQDLASQLERGLKSLNPLDWVQYFVFIGVIILLIVLVIFLFPCLLKCLFSSLQAVKQERGQSLPNLCSGKHLKSQPMLSLLDSLTGTPKAMAATTEVTIEMRLSD
ncbi:endogenous retrovirus group K member 25 Env polyprotein-like [Alexandromys fortis]|uniref:endogenous retrovirus group K member 25 Env polyprotein-like n=1 Tax=Alexandromys fortis TaxID=100897 RepID=UPI00215314AD|nr:endogenous retrovirus group K member 25 Env polyprotein-like [Microtus fortis]